MIRGLGPRFATQAELLPLQVPFPIFARARSSLLLAEMCTPQLSSLQIPPFVVNTVGTNAGLPSSTDTCGSSSGKGGKNRRKNDVGSKGGHNAAGGAIGSGQRPVPASGLWVQPWATSWRPVGGQGILRPRPNYQQAYTASQASDIASQTTYVAN
ncbi:hypothetical protein E2562_016027 [Oryza meyeriana var. granulata]|uniref:Uncharacterized protein n=1 Tax=Oryza meyeriana var. granulata TaxID=110450 RepID=A0A6G1EJV1_9ORYZ|nr:hypothetical protein E2562_016027 [Oryza meyeriana var. granulata]